MASDFDDRDVVDERLCYAKANAGDDDLLLDCLTIAVPRLRAEVTRLRAPASQKQTAIDHATLRIMLAGQALEGILADASAGGIEHEDAVARFKVCRAAAQYAEALLAELGLGVPT